MPTHLEQGLTVEYKGFVGVITFVDSVYLTVCLYSGDGRTYGNVCMVVYKNEWDTLVVK